ncbi:MAG: hypothetical protein HND57_02465 [Planctomycetes bacterium]|nr:hypothetical protein [Planctomycetota bacterium]
MNQQHAAARILLALKGQSGLVSSLSHLQGQYGVSRRTLERTRAKLARLGLIEHHTWMNSNFPGQSGWRLSTRFTASLRQLANKVDEWRMDSSPGRKEKDERLVGLLG